MFYTMGAKFLPTYPSLERHGQLVQLKHTHLVVKLSEIIRDNQIMQEHGQKIICLLIQGLMELKNLKVSLRAISPEHI